MNLLRVKYHTTPFIIRIIILYSPTKHFSLINFIDLFLIYSLQKISAQVHKTHTAHFKPFMGLDFVWMFASGGHIEKSHVSEHLEHPAL